MKRLVNFSVFESRSDLTTEQMHWLDYCSNSSWVLGEDGRVNVHGNFDCSNLNLKDFMGISFGFVKGSFKCDRNSLTTLKGAPQNVASSFSCVSNKLVSLEGGPSEVGTFYYCSKNYLRNLKGSPEKIHLTFNCSENPELESLEGAPREARNFYCYDCGLETLKGGPEMVKETFICSSNRLKSLEGAPRSVGDGLACVRNPLESLEGAPETMDGEFYSDSIEIPKGQWGLSGWLKVLEEGEPEAQKLILTIISPEALNKRLEESPEKVMVALKSVWNSPGFAKTRSQLKIPKGYEDEMDLLGDLDDVGL